MGWSIGYDDNWKRDIGYGVPCLCDHPGCNEEIDRGLSYVCADQEPYGGEGCGLYFCEAHRRHEILAASDDDDSPIYGCERCGAGADPFSPKPDVLRWVQWKLTDESWKEWRDENPEEVKRLQSEVSAHKRVAR